MSGKLMSAFFRLLLGLQPIFTWRNETGPKAIKFEAIAMTFMLESSPEHKRRATILSGLRNRLSRSLSA